MKDNGPAYTEEQKQQIITAAAKLSNKPASDLSFDDAKEILEGKGIKMPTYNPDADKAAALLWAKISAGQLRKIMTAEAPEEIEAAVNTAIDKTAQKVRKGILTPEAQEDTDTYIAELIKAAKGNEIEIRDILKDYLQAMGNDHISDFREIAEAIKGNFAQNSIAEETIETITNTAKEALADITEFINSDNYKAIKEQLQAVSSFIEETQDEFKSLEDAGSELQELAPFLQMELEKEQDNPDYTGCHLEDVLQHGFGDNLKPAESIFSPLIEKAKQALKDYKAAQELTKNAEQAAEKLPRIRYKKTDNIRAITDKLANKFFYNQLEPPKNYEVTGQRSLLSYEDKDSKKEITLFYDYTYNDEVLEKYGLSKKFDAFDWLVMTIVDNLSAAGNDTVSLTKIFSEMGGKGSPTSDQLEPIYRSLLKGMSTIITIDDAEVQKAWGNETYNEIVSPVIPVVMNPKRFVANGKIVDSLIKIGTSPFMSVAYPIGHVTAWEKRILQLYTGRKTARYYKVMRYLMIQIAFMRTGNRSHKLLYSSFYDDTESKTAREQQLSREMMFRLLDEVFIPAEYISKYKETDKNDPHAGVVLTLCKKRLSDNAQKTLEDNKYKKKPKKKG